MIHLVVQQKVTQHCKATIPQLKKKKKASSASLFAYLKGTSTQHVGNRHVLSRKPASFAAPVYLGYYNVKLESHP